MKSLLIALVVTSASCAHSYFGVTNQGATTRLCNAPELVAIGNDVPAAYHKAIVNSFKYWNEAIGKQVFFDAGKVNFNAYSDDAAGFVIVGVLNKEADEETVRPGHNKAVTFFKYRKDDGCIAQVKVLINPKTFGNDLDKFETTVRHEFGHVLGFQHSAVFTDLMFDAPSSESTTQNPRDASDDEVQAVRELYKH